MNRLGRACIGALVGLLATGFGAQAQSPDDLSGIWKRVKTESSKESYFRISSGEDGFTGELLTPPEGMRCELALTLEDGKVNGTASWLEEGFDPLVTKWEFTYADGQLTGRSEWVSWDDDGNESRGWENHALVRAEKVGLVTAGSADEAPFGEPVEPLAQLAGGWKGPGGGWSVKVEGTSVTLKPAGHHEEVFIEAEDDRGTLRGRVTLPGGASCDVELAFDEGKLVGRSSWVEAPGLGERAVKGWAPLTFERLERMEVGPADASADAPPASEGSLVGVWKRDDGLYLRVREQAGETTGVLSDAAGGAKCRLRFALVDGVWKGTANWGAYESGWELAVTADGLVGRAEWVDVLDDQVVARGWSGRTFTALKRIQ